jgi:hypothetical protein
VLEGKKYVEIQSELGILPGTWDVWVFKDYRNFRKNLTAWKQERMVKKAERNIEELLEMPVTVMEIQGKGEDAEQVVIEDPALIKIKQDTSKFVLERLNKDEYSPRVENTGKDGEKLTGIEVKIIKNESQPEGDGSVRQELPSQEQNSGEPGGNEKQQDVLAGPVVRSEGDGGEERPVHDLSQDAPIAESHGDEGLS